MKSKTGINKASTIIILFFNIEDDVVNIKLDEMAKFDQKPYMDITFARFKIAGGISGLYSDGGTISSFICISATDTGLSASNGTLPVSIS